MINHKYHGCCGRLVLGYNYCRRVIASVGGDGCGGSSHHGEENLKRRRFFVTTSSSSSSSSLSELRIIYKDDIERLAETRALKSLTQFLNAKKSLETTTTATTTTRTTTLSPYDDVNDTIHADRSPSPIVPVAPKAYRHVMTSRQTRQTVDAVLSAFSLHVESRIAALVGRGYYTIGPCGEETLSSAAHALRSTDSTALHYRHLGVNLNRGIIQMSHKIDPNDGYDEDVNLFSLLKDRARGYTVSRLDPVTGGVHCSIGSASGHDHLVTSTLASQCPPAVGRALGYSMMMSPPCTTTIDDPLSSSSSSSTLRDRRERRLSFVTLGDGSIHHGHFWSAFHLARHAHHKRIKCPVVFGISDNGLSIS